MRVQPMARFWWMMLGAAGSGTATYLILRKLREDQSDERAKLPMMMFGQTEKRRFDDLNQIFDGVEEDLEEPWL